MVTVREVDQSRLVQKVAQDLQKRLVMPDWAKFIKTGVSRERPPEQADWWYLRAASILRKVYLTGPVGTEHLRTYYGGNKSYGASPAHTKAAGGKVIRTILQELERAKLVEKVNKPRKGRKITAVGQRMLDAAAKEISV